MNTFLSLMVAVSVLGFFICLLWLILAAIIRKPTSKPQTGMLVCIALLLVGVFASAVLNPSKQSNSISRNNIKSSREPVQDKTDKADTQSNEYTQPPKITPANDEAFYEITYSNVRTYTNSIGTIRAQVIVEITNTGTTDLYLSTASYDLEDENGQLIESRSMALTYPNVISPGETGYMYEETTLDHAVSGNLFVKPRFSIQRAKIENIRLEVTDVSLSVDKYGGVKALGRIENTSSSDQNIVYIVFILLDDSRTPIGQLFTLCSETLAPGEKIGFEAGNMSLPDDVIENTAEYLVYAYPWQLQF